MNINTASSQVPQYAFLQQTGSLRLCKGDGYAKHG